MDEEIFRLVERTHRQAIGGEQILHRSEDGWIVIHQTDFPSLAGLVHAARVCGLRGAVRRKKQRAPRSGRFSATRRGSNVLARKDSSISFGDFTVLHVRTRPDGRHGETLRRRKV